MSNYKSRKTGGDRPNTCTEAERQIFNADPFYTPENITLYRLFYESDDQCFLTEIQQNKTWTFSDDEESQFTPSKLLSTYLDQEWPSHCADIQLLVSTLWQVRLSRHAAADALLNFFLAVGEHLKFWFVTETQIFDMAPNDVELARFKRALLEEAGRSLSEELYEKDFCKFWLDDWLPFFVKLKGPDADVSSDEKPDPKSGGGSDTSSPSKSVNLAKKSQEIEP